jgi:hypothetical protein
MKKTPKSTDVNTLASQIVAEATEDETIPEGKPKEKNPAAVALGRLGGLKGGKARFDKLSKKRRIEIAKEGAKARWGENKK